uniref:Uncharacterized protein n=1 Tax=Arundo donax TaxID=35708 RepID=A0A0A9AM86_ARUDO
MPLHSAMSSLSCCDACQHHMILHAPFLRNNH